MAASVIIVGGGAAGFFAASALLEVAPDTHVAILEKGPDFLAKVRISGGGRCNVTHACFDPKTLSSFYPRGGSALLGPFHRFQPRDTIEWFERHGVKLKTEADGRMFPVTDRSQTIVDCLVRSARELGADMRHGCGVKAVVPKTTGGFEVELSSGEKLACGYLLLATGGCRSRAGGDLAVSLGHTLAEPVPSLFTFQIKESWLHRLAGISLDEVQVGVPGHPLEAAGPLLITHTGLSGPAILKLSAWGARILHEADYKFTLQVNWLPGDSDESLRRKLGNLRGRNPAKLIVNTPLSPLPARLWAALVEFAKIPTDTRWASLSRPAEHQLVQTLLRSLLPVSGKSLNKDEFVTCGGVPLGEVDFKTMQSKRCPGLYFAGELLDIDALTGGFNFQAAWTTGWIAGRAIAEAIQRSASPGRP